VSVTSCLYHAGKADDTIAREDFRAAPEFGILVA